MIRKTIVVVCRPGTAPKAKAVRDWACLPKYRSLLGNRRKDRPADTAKRQDVLMTVRRDVLSIRNRILEGSREKALAESDWLLDNIENRLAEGC